MSEQRWESVGIFDGYNGNGRHVLQQKVEIRHNTVVPLDEHRVMPIRALE